MRKACLLITTILTVVSCKPKTPKSVINNTDNFTKYIKTVEAIKEHPTKEISFAGRVINNPDLTVSYSSLVNGVIERSYFSLGEYVTKGQVMLDIRSTELSALETDLIALETSLQVAEREFIKIEDMFTDNLASEQEYLECKAKVKQIKASYDKVKGDISIYGKSKGAGLFSIIAPVSGYVILKTGSAGGSVFSQGDPLFSITNLQEVWVIANIYAGNIQFVHEGMKADISSISYPDELFEGKISVMSQVFDPDDKTLKARIVLPNPSIKLKPGMPVVVKLKSHATEASISLPTETVIFDNDSYFVVVQKDKEYSVREVTVAGHHADQTYITSGISPGESIVAKNQLLIYNDLKDK